MGRKMSASTLPPMADPIPQEVFPPALSETARIVNIFVAPSRTFTDLKRRAVWWAPWLLVAITSLAPLLTVGHRVGYEELFRQAVAHSSTAQQFEGQTPAQQQNTIVMGAKIIRIGYYLNPVFGLIYGLIIAGILMAVFNFGFRAEIPFSRAMGIVFYSNLPWAVSGIFALLSVIVSSNPAGHVQNMLPSNPAYFLDPTTSSKFLYGVLTGVDIFAIWTICLTGIGFALSSNSQKLSRRAAIATVGALFLIWKLTMSAIGLGG